MTPLTIPIGPNHPALKEPLSITLQVSGEEVLDSAIRVGYVHRGIERLCQQRTYVQNVHLIERICGICSHVHTTAFCRAVEALGGLSVPPRAGYVRTLLCELERIHSHLLWLGVLCESIGFTTLFMYAWRDREMILDIMEELSGGRVSHAVNVVGGVRIDMDSAMADKVVAQLDRFAEQISLFVDLVEEDRSLRARTRGLGVLSTEMVQTMGLVGPIARASGYDLDLRRDAPYHAYTDLAVHVVTAAAGDLWSRLQVRVHEVVESLRLCRSIVANLPEGDVSVRAPRRVPAGEVVVRCEAPRGELLYYLESDGSDRPARVKIRTPSMPALMSLREQLRGRQMADVSAIIAGADLCIACADR